MNEYIFKNIIYWNMSKFGSSTLFSEAIFLKWSIKDVIRLYVGKKIHPKC